MDAQTNLVNLSPTNAFKAYVDFIDNTVNQGSAHEDYQYFSFKAIDNAYKSSLARATLGVSPAGLSSLYYTWLSHLALSPGKQAELAEKGARKLYRSARYLQSAMNNESPCCIEPLPQDHRFSHPGWNRWPYNFLQQNFLLTQQWWYNATTNIDGLSAEDERSISFIARQILDRYSPSNNPLLNPEVLQVTIEQGGSNLVSGLQNLMDDMERQTSSKPAKGSENFIPGEQVATTPGKVVYRNHLMELIQYTPTTQNIYPEPVLIVPAWIMKYYILDLSAQNSMVKYLVDQGHTVFMISWFNPSSVDRDLEMINYQKQGVMRAIDEISTRCPDTKIHTAGYCLGGTLLTITAATMARDGDDRLKSMTHFAAQVDFTEAGELMLFTNESEISYLEKMMWDQGVLDGSQMAGAFQILRSNDLIWSRIVHQYLLGESSSMNDLMAWNSDLTRMPYKMHSQYLRRLFLNNDLSSGRYIVDGKPIAISDIHIPIFSVGTEKDHVAPWHSVYKIHLISDSPEVTFVLTSGGHNAGIVSEPGHPHRHYRIARQNETDKYIDPESWVLQNNPVEGSWWPSWQVWLANHSAEKQPHQALSTHWHERGLCAAPGTYVLQR